VPLDHCAQPARREPEQLPDLHGAERDAARVLLGVVVALSEAERERAHVRAQERLLGEDEVGRVQVAGQRPRLDGAGEIEGDGGADGEDAVELQAVTEPPAELDVRHRQRRHQ
jgi:hypothetical protein